MFFPRPLDFIFTVDIISAIEFDGTGDHLATGDRGGRVVLFERTDTRDVSLLFVDCRLFMSFVLFCFSSKLFLESDFML